MTIESAIKMLCTMYGKALTDKKIKKPISYALYHTWEYFDAREEKKPKEEEKQDRGKNNDTRPKYYLA